METQQDDEQWYEVAREGADACAEGEPVAACPYPDGSMRADAWETGWHEEADFRARR